MHYRVWYVVLHFVARKLLANVEKGAAITIPTAIGIIGHTIPPGRVKNYSFAFYSGGAPVGQVVGNIFVSISCLGGYLRAR